ncbi:unnamed protein product [Caenorhabditis bovis]|uniref:MAGE domain-containing protein n=1 Tax=Caenorhabditis bovis TaxID=2654633 RepID=A0A8S1FAJ6_9PELO|nr:unnamed protein product [Caenorhabditis bovis]
MSDTENDALSLTREEARLTTELFVYIVETLVLVSRNVTISYIYVADAKKVCEAQRSEKNLFINDDKICFVNLLKMPITEQNMSEESHKINGILKAALMYIFVAKNNTGMEKGVLFEEIIQFLEVLCTRNNDKLNTEQMNLIKKYIAPNNKAIFIKNGWISFTKSNNENDEDEFRMDWGPVAQQSVDPTKLLELFQNQTDFPVSNLLEQTKRAMELKGYQFFSSSEVGADPLFILQSKTKHKPQLTLF